MSLIVVLIILFLLFGGGGFVGYRRGYYGGRGYGGGLIFTLLVILLLFWALSGAHAQTAAPSTSVAVAPWYAVAQPYLLEIFGVIFSVLLTWALSILQTHTNVKVSDQAKASVQQAAMNAAGRIFAMLGNKLAPITVDVHNTLIANEVPKIVAALPKELKQAGMTPNDVNVRLQNLVAGKLGQLQAQAAIPMPVVQAQPQPAPANG